MSNQIINPENLVYQKSSLLLDNTMHYCPGCSHGTVHRIVAEVIEEMNMQEKTIGVAPVGCAVFIYNYLDFDFAESAHGRAPALATAIKRLNPDHLVFTYQGDGDLAAIGTGETIHACNRGENIAIIFINNGIYGMTGGQMAPTTLVGQVTATSPYGRDASLVGSPIRLSEMLATLDGAKYIARVAVNNPKNMAVAKAAMKKAFEVQLRGEGFAMVEVLSTCPTNWGKTPIKAVKWLEENMIPQFPLGVYKNDGGELK
ncbi:MAG TPA: thiamine pyrophosphate-dependent enzyme [Bacteroidales bacterium]